MFNCVQEYEKYHAHHNDAKKTKTSSSINNGSAVDEAFYKNMIFQHVAAVAAIGVVTYMAHSRR